jgi:t-SNARE complex subunit (syntaxin)
VHTRPPGRSGRQQLAIQLLRVARDPAIIAFAQLCFVVIIVIIVDFVFLFCRRTFLSFGCRNVTTHPL